MHTILGAGGPVANALARELIKANHRIRLVSRRPANFNAPNVDWQKADLLNYNELIQAAQGSTVIYLCAGLAYNKKVWMQQWPMIMQNVINITLENEARLIFVDNVYMYGLVNGTMTEDTPYNPISSKGEVRAKIASTLMDKVKAGNLNATIARAPDFYGSETLNSFLDSMVLAKLARRKKAQWLGNADRLHNFIYVPDAGKAIAVLGQQPESGNQVWHLPTAQAITGKQFIELAARVFSAKSNYNSINKSMLGIAALFDNATKEMKEMYYQYAHDYNFKSDKFENAFGMKPSTYEQGLTELSHTLFKP